MAMLCPLKNMEELGQIVITSVARALSPVLGSVRRSGAVVLEDMCLSTVEVNAFSDKRHCSFCKEYLMKKRF